MNIIILGAAGFIGTNLTKRLLKINNAKITLVDYKKDFFKDQQILNSNKIKIIECNFDEKTDYSKLLFAQDIVFHLVSVTIPGNSNHDISLELGNSAVLTAKLLDACVNEHVKKIIFTSSGGAVYGIGCKCPISEDVITRPITTYGIQKVNIENMLYLYNYMYGLDYNVVRIANPYGPYQRPDGRLGAVTTFTYRAIKNKKIKVYGDGEIIRDYIYIDDVIDAIINICFKKCNEKVLNIGSGYGHSLNDVLNIISNILNIKLNIEYCPKRNVDIPVNYLNISKYENIFGKLVKTSFKDGIIKTAKFLKENY